MEDVRFAYKANPGVLALATAFFAVTAGALWFGAAEDGRALIINGLVHLTPEQARVFYRVLAVVGALMAAAGLAGTISGLMKPRYLVFGPTSVSIPGYIGKRGQTIAYADIRGLDRQQINSQRFVYVHHKAGKIAIMGSMLPGREAFDTVCSLLAARSGRTAA